MTARSLCFSLPRLASVAACIVLLGGCATHVPVKRETGALNLQYQVAPTTQKTDKTIAIVSPLVAGLEAAATNDRGSAVPSNPFLAAMMAQAGGRATGQFSGQSQFERNYRTRLADAIFSSLQEIAASKGFRTKGPFPSFDDIPFGDKKTLYLVGVPSLRVFIDQKSERSECKNNGMACIDEGTIAITGELVFKMIEPLTNQAMMTKRINLSDFGIQKRYVHEFQSRTHSGDLVGTLLDKATAPAELRDNTDRVMTEAMNEFFQKAMGKIDTLMSQEELLAFEQDVLQLKGLKRF